MNPLSLQIAAVNEAVSRIVWGPGMLLLLMGTGVWLTLRLRWVQLTRFPLMMRKTLGSLSRGRRAARGGNLTPFQAMTTALAGTVGTGNIAGVTGAIFLGGPGAVFWMWVAAFFGMATKMVEIVLAVDYRETDAGGGHRGGPMYYMERGLGARWLALLFSLAGGLAAFGIGNVAQSCEIAAAMEGLLGWRPGVTGLLLTLVVGAALLGGIRRIGRVTAGLVPFMALLYLAAGAAVILPRLPQVPAALAAIFRGAFSPAAVGGGTAGWLLAMRQGIARGVFSNEAGLGSAPMIHAAADTDQPVEQGMWGVFEVFADTIVICTVTALVVLLSGILEVPGGLDAYPSAGAAATAAFQRTLPGGLGDTVLQISMLCFALSTILSWSCYGQLCWGYLTGNRALPLYRICFALVCAAGAVGGGQLMWDLSDTLNGLMAIPNLIALSGGAVRRIRRYFARQPGGIPPQNR